MRRIVTAREQVEMLAPWRTAAEDFDYQNYSSFGGGSDPNVNMSRQVNKAKARAQEAHDRGDHELGVYLEGLHGIMTDQADKGNPRPWSTYEPMAHEEFDLHTSSLYRDGIVKKSIPEHLDRKWKEDAMKEIEENDWEGVTLSNQPGDAPTSGYMVSLPRSEGHEESHPMDDLSGATLGDYGERKRDVINEPGNSQGGWNNKKRNQWVNDVSQNHEDLWHADKAAFQGDQDALWDLNNDREIDTEEGGWMTGAPWIVGSRDG